MGKDKVLPTQVTCEGVLRSTGLNKWQIVQPDGSAVPLAKILMPYEGRRVVVQIRMVR